MYVKVQHACAPQETVYCRADSKTPLLKIGALSYADELHITDFSDDANPDQERGLIEVGNAARSARILKSIFMASMLIKR